MLKHVFIAGNMAFISLGGLHVSQVTFFLHLLSLNWNFT